jgi:hypothetical protein
MSGKIKMGIRKKAAVLMIVLILVPSALVLAIDYSLKEAVTAETADVTEDILMEQMLNYSVALNRNASVCMQEYLSSIEVSAESASMVIPGAI